MMVLENLYLGINVTTVLGNYVSQPFMLMCRNPSIYCWQNFLRMFKPTQN